VLLVRSGRWRKVAQDGPVAGVEKPQAQRVCGANRKRKMS
jgi:hypothetical protein